MVYCQSCGKELNYDDFNQVYDKTGKQITVCNECKKGMPSDGIIPISQSNSDRWNHSSTEHLKPQRPLGVTILAILEFIGGILGIILILFLQSFFLYVGFFPADLLAILVALVVLLSALQILVGYGLIKGYGWAWTAEFILRIANGVFSGLFGLIFAVLIIIYLTRPHVKEYFGKI